MASLPDAQHLPVTLSEIISLGLSVCFLAELGEDSSPQGESSIRLQRIGALHSSASPGESGGVRGSQGGDRAHSHQPGAGIALLPELEPRGRIPGLSITLRTHPDSDGPARRPQGLRDLRGLASRNRLRVLICPLLGCCLAQLHCWAEKKLASR